MTSRKTDLRLEPAKVERAFEDGNVTRHPESCFLDLVLDGVPLRSHVGAPGSDMVTELNRPWLPEVTAAVERLLGQRPSEDLPAGRVPLLVCQVDGDLGCGQLTAALDLGPAEVSWSAFLWEDDYSDPRPVEGLADSFTFERTTYEDAFRDAYERVAAFPYDKLAHRGRRFLWPWQWGWKMPSE
jgi:hypothetical protein